MGLDDWMVTLLILLALWTFVPRPIRRAVRSGLGPSVDAIAQSIRAGVRVLSGWITIAAYRGLLGVPVPGSVRDIEREQESTRPEPPPAKSELTSSGAVRGGSGAGSEGAVLSQQNRPGSEKAQNFDEVLSYLLAHKLSDEELAKLLAVTQRLNGDYLLSANKIRDVVGGSDAAIKAHVSPLRPKKEQPPPSPSIRRPADGW